MSLPSKTTLDDVSAIVTYLKLKPTGATLTEARAVVDPKILDGRKLKAYAAWDIVQQDGDKYKLTDRGRRLARDPGEAVEIYREIISSIPTYRASLEWAYHQSLSVLTVDDLAANWHEHHKAALGTEQDAAIKAVVTCFFNVADGAGVGKYLLGRGGQPTRLELDRAVLKNVIEEGPAAPPWAAEVDDEPDADTDADTEEPKDERRNQGNSAGSSDVLDDIARAGESQNPHPETVRVFISHGKNMEVVDQVKTILDLADINWELAVEEESAAIPVPDKVFGAMRNCNAGIICVSAEEDTNGDMQLNQNVLIEIGAAFVLYDRRVVLLWDKRIPVPSNLQGLYRCEFEGNELSWTAGTKLMKAIQGFKQN